MKSIWIDQNEWWRKPGKHFTSKDKMYLVSPPQYKALKNIVFAYSSFHRLAVNAAFSQSLPSLAHRSRCLFWGIHSYPEATVHRHQVKSHVRVGLPPNGLSLAFSSRKPVSRVPDMLANQQVYGNNGSVNVRQVIKPSKLRRWVLFQHQEKQGWGSRRVSVAEVPDLSEAQWNIQTWSWWDVWWF